MRAATLIVGKRPEINRYSSVPGFAYVYFIYGTSYMLNVSAEEPGVGAGVLLRAIEPLDGINLMKRLRKTDKVTDLARGPGRLGSALEIDERLDGVDLCASGPLWLGTSGSRNCARSYSSTHRHHTRGGPSTTFL